MFAIFAQARNTTSTYIRKRLRAIRLLLLCKIETPVQHALPIGLLNRNAFFDPLIGKFLTLKSQGYVREALHFMDLTVV